MLSFQLVGLEFKHRLGPVQLEVVAFSSNFAHSPLINIMLKHRASLEENSARAVTRGRALLGTWILIRQCRLIGPLLRAVELKVTGGESG